MKFEAGHLRSGDIIFVLPTTAEKGKWWVQKLNVFGQRLLAWMRRTDRISPRKKTAMYSHVILGLDSGNVIHADGNTVALESVESALNIGDNTSYKFQIYRCTRVGAENGSVIAMEAIRFLKANYDFKTYLRPSPAPEKKDSTQFCSKLIATSFREAGVTITKLADNRVLPIDLWNVCQAHDWVEITEEFTSDVNWEKAAEVLGPIDIPGHGSIDLATFMEHSDHLMREVAANNREVVSLQRDQFDSLLVIENLLTQHALALLDLAKMVRLDPQKLDDELAAKICKLVTQLPQLLMLGKLNSIDDVLDSAPLYLGLDKDPGRSVYAGLPSQNEIMRLRALRETLQIHSYLLLAELGMLCIAAKVSMDEKLEIFRIVDEKLISDFIDAAPRVDDFSLFEISDADFEWMGSQDDQDTSKRIATSILASWKIANLLPKVKKKEPFSFS